MSRDLGNTTLYQRSSKAVKKAYIDTADTGKDNLCGIFYDELPEGNYVTDVLYTQKPMEYTEPRTAEMLTKNNTKKATVESNNGGKGFARAVEKQCREMGNNNVEIKWFHQSANKEVRIFNNSAAAQNLNFLPSRMGKECGPNFTEQ